MPIQPANPFVIHEADFFIGALGDTEVDPATDVDYAAAFDTIQAVPSTSTVSWTGLKRNTFTDVSPATWTLTGNGAQDWDDEGSLSRFLHEHDGETRPYLFRPKSGGTGVRGQLILSAGAIGGAGNAVAPFSITFGLTGKPELVPAPVAP